MRLHWKNICSNQVELSRTIQFENNKEKWHEIIIETTDIVLIKLLTNVNIIELDWTVIRRWLFDGVRWSRKSGRIIYLIVSMGRKAAWNRLHKKCKKVTPKRCKKITTNVHYCSAEGGRVGRLVRVITLKLLYNVANTTFYLLISKLSAWLQILSGQNVFDHRQIFNIGRSAV